MSARLPGAVLQRIAVRFAPDAVRERLLLPLIADLQFEHARARGPAERMIARTRAVAAFWVLLLGVGGWTVLVGTREERATAGRSILRALAVTATLTAVVTIQYCWQMLDRYPSLLRFYPLTLPATLAAALPLGVLIGGALGRSTGAVEHLRASWRVALASAAVTFALTAWLAPRANQALWQGVARAASADPSLRIEPRSERPDGPPPRFDYGHRAMTLGQLSERAAHVRAWGRGLDELPLLQAEWHKRPALGVACLALSLLGVGLGRSRWRRLWRGLGAFAIGVGFYAALHASARLVNAGGTDPVLAVWMPVVALGLCTFALRRAVPILARS